MEIADVIMVLTEQGPQSVLIQVLDQAQQVWQTCKTSWYQDGSRVSRIQTRPESGSTVSASIM